MAFSSSTVSIGKSTKQTDYQRLLDNTIALKNEAIELSGIKTFQSGTVFEIKPKLDGIVTRSGTGSVSVECQYTSSAGNSVVNLKTKIIEIGDWDMDATPGVGITHGVTFSKIKSVSAIILQDNTVNAIPLNTGNSITDSTPQGFIGFITTTSISLLRLTGGIFDVTLYNATSFNRGWVTIQYEE